MFERSMARHFQMFLSMWSLNVLHSDRRETPDTSGPRLKVILSPLYSFRCRSVHFHRCLESGAGRPLTLLGISTFIFILNFLNSLRNQSDQTVLTSNRPSCLIPSPFSLAPRHYYHWIPLPFYSRLSTYLHTFDDLYFHFASLHLPPSVCFSVSPSPGCPDRGFSRTDFPAFPPVRLNPRHHSSYDHPKFVVPPVETRLRYPYRMTSRPHLHVARKPRMPSSRFFQLFVIQCLDPPRS
jgi:hypothetical protein